MNEWLVHNHLAISFETAYWCNDLICWSFCSREYGCNNMEATSRCAAMLLERCEAFK